MKTSKKTALWAAACAYLFLIGFFVSDALHTHQLKIQRMADFTAFSEMYVKLPPLPPAGNSSDPLLIRLQKSLEDANLADLKDRAPKWSGKDASGGQAAGVTLSVEGVPFERLSALLERLSTESDVSVPAFRVERSGASKERFDFAATFAARRPPSPGSVPSAP